MAIGDMIATRDGFGDEIVKLGQENCNIYVVDADIGLSLIHIYCIVSQNFIYTT